MCYESKCSKCGKTSWGGCGRHVASVYKQIPEGQHCACKDWPGVNLASKASSGDGSSSLGSSDTAGAQQQQQQEEPSSSSCAIM